MIEDELDVPVQRVTGKRGQFDVVVDGEVIADRSAGWPDPEAVIAKIEALLRQKA